LSSVDTRSDLEHYDATKKDIPHEFPYTSQTRWVE